jgi:hypothetical membrane protein
MDLLLISLIGSVLIGVFANSKNRSGFGWFLLSIFITPILTFIILAILSEKTVPTKSLETRLSEIERLRDKGTISLDEYELKRKGIIESNL